MLFDELTCVRIEQNHLSAAPSACDFQKVYLRSFRCCNKCQANLFCFQRFDIMFNLSSSPKACVCSRDYHRFGSRCQTLQYNPRSCYMQTRWTAPPTTFLSVRFYAGSQLQFYQCQYSENEIGKHFLEILYQENGIWKEIFLAMGIETTFVHPMIYTR